MTVDAKPVASAPTPITTLEGGEVRIHASAGRATPKGPSFGNVMAKAKPLLKGAEAAASVLPGGPLVAAAVKGAPAAAAMSGPAPVAAGKPTVGGVPMVPTTGVAPSTGGAPSVSGVGAATSEGGVESMLAESQAFNLYYLQLQEEVSAENRSFTTMSNVLKARHDTVKNAIGNIR